jgi:hypothetical protein
VFRIGKVPISKTKVIYLGNAMACAGEKGLLAFNVYEGVPHVVDEFGGYGFVVLRVLCRDVVSFKHTYGVPLCRAFYMGR